MIFAQALKSDCSPTQEAYGGDAGILLDCAAPLPNTGFEVFFLVMAALILFGVGYAMRKASTTR